MNNYLYTTLSGTDYSIDYLILSKLLNLARYGEYFAPICDDSYFWYLVATYHFPGVIPTPGTTWFRLIEFLISDKVKDTNQGLILSAKVGNLSLIEFFLNKGASYLNLGMYEAG